MLKNRLLLVSILLFSFIILYSRSDKFVQAQSNLAATPTPTPSSAIFTTPPTTLTTITRVPTRNIPATPTIIVPTIVVPIVDCGPRGCATCNQTCDSAGLICETGLFCFNPPDGTAGSDKCINPACPDKPDCICDTSITPTTQPTTNQPTSLTPPSCSDLSDANKDGVADLKDFQLFKAEYLDGKTTTEADYNCDGVVNLTDFELWATDFIEGQNQSATTTPSITITLSPSPPPTTSTFSIFNLLRSLFP